MIIKTLTKKLLLIWLLGVASATLVTFSQAENSPVSVEAAALTLPADNVEIIDVEGRKLTVKVLRHNIVRPIDKIRR